MIDYGCLDLSMKVEGLCNKISYRKVFYQSARVEVSIAYHLKDSTLDLEKHKEVQFFPK